MLQHSRRAWRSSSTRTVPGRGGACTTRGLGDNAVMAARGQSHEKAAGGHRDRRETNETRMRGRKRARGRRPSAEAEPPPPRRIRLCRRLQRALEAEPEAPEDDVTAGRAGEGPPAPPDALSTSFWDKLA